MSTLPIQEFEKSSEIKDFIGKQWADMFKNYLSSLRNEKENRKIENSVNEMKALIQKMNIMLDNVGKNVLSKENPEEYENVVNQQKIILFCDNIATKIHVTTLHNDMRNIYDSKEAVKKILNYLRQSKIVTQEDLDLLLNEMHCLKVINISMDNDVLNGCEILQDEKNMKKIIEVLSQKKYISKIVTAIY